MCILCDRDTLELLTTRLEGLEPGRLADGVRAAREAAGPGVLDRAELVLRGDLAPTVDAALYEEVVVARAFESGVLSRGEASRWERRLGTAEGVLDPRVQAFVSACAEIIDDYRVLMEERRQVLERFVESSAGAVQFSWLGQDGELWFEYREESYVVLAQEEAHEIAEREVSAVLYSLSPEELLRYTALPETGLEILVSTQAKPAEVANSILAGLIDLPALAEDRARAFGFAEFFRGEAGRPVEDLRFGEWIIIRASGQDG